MARKQLDKRLKILQNVDILARPPRGWIKAIREALGMTTAQLGKRLGVSQPRVLGIENAEVSGSITLDSLERQLVRLIVGSSTPSSRENLSSRLSRIGPENSRRNAYGRPVTAWHWKISG